MRYPLALAAALVLAGCAHEEASPSPQSAAPQAAPPKAAAVTPVQRDWRWVQGAVFVPTNCVNEAQQWDEYDPAINDRELHYASVYGINVVRVYLHYLIYLKKKAAMLGSIEDFLTRADKYGIRTEFVFFDDCWNQPPKDILSADYHYPAPIPGVHNSRWLVCPGDEVRDHYDEHRAGLKAYVQDIVNAHRADPRVVFWEIYNEPNKSAATVRLEADALGWIKATGTAIPVTATGKEFSGGAFSDFSSWHEYGGYALGGDAFSLCTECMNRQGQSVPGVVNHFKGEVGYIMWELGIGRDNCRFAWTNDRAHPRADETPIPFHGIIYPDGHPWSLGDAKALLGDDGYARTPFFVVQYYKDTAFAKLAKTSVTPTIDYDLVDEPGVGTPDASAGMPRENFSVGYNGQLAAPETGTYTFTVTTDGAAELRVDGERVFAKTTVGRGTASGTAKLRADNLHMITLRYVHEKGGVSLHLFWSGPGLTNRIVEPATHPPDF